jgi:hypothetical protein
MLRAMSKRTAEAQHFLSNVGDAPTFFIPDSGKPGAKAVLSGAGELTEVAEVGRWPGHEARTVEGKGELPAVGPRVGFELPRLAEVGEYTLTVDDDGTRYSYVITVVDPAAEDYTDTFRAWKQAHSGEDA